MADSALPGFRSKVLDRLTAATRWLPKGRTTAHRAIWRILGAPPRFVGTVDGQRFAVDTSDRNIATNIYLWQEWEPPSTAIWLALLAPGQVVVDVGANKGWFSLLAAKRVLPGGRVISYEPLPGNVADLQSTSEINGHSHWTVRPVAASDRAGVAQLQTPKSADGSGWGSLETKDDRDLVTIDVPLVELATDLAEQGIERVDLLKMDIEGHEHAALKGLLPLLRAGKVGHLLVEIHLSYLGRERFGALMEMMAGTGYAARWLDESALTEDGWRLAYRGLPDRSVLDRLVSVSGADDPVIRDRRYFKLLWSSPATAP